MIVVIYIYIILDVYTLLYNKGLSAPPVTSPRHRTQLSEKIKLHSISTFPFCISSLSV